MLIRYCMHIMLLNMSKIRMLQLYNHKKKTFNITYCVRDNNIQVRPTCMMCVKKVIS